MLEAEAGRVELRQHVVLGYGPYRLTSNDLVITQRPGVIELEGAARLAPCPCPDPPVTLAFSSARLADGGDVALTFPRLEIERVPVFVLPWILLRPADKPGLLPPIVEYRGDDGLLLGGGARMPFGGDAGAAEVTVAGYAKGGVEIGTRVSTPRTTTHLVLDELSGERAVFDARGAVPIDAAGKASPVTLAWDADAIRGDRAIVGTPDLFQAARPFDTAAVEASRASAGAVSTSIAAGVLARGERGLGPLVAGPRASVGLGGAIGRSGSFDASGALDVLGASFATASTSIATATAGAELDPRAGPLDVRLATRAHARTAGASDDDDPTREATIGATATLGVPLVRRFDAGADGAPLVHWLEPLVEAGAAAGDRHGDFFEPVLGPLARSAWMLAGGASTSFGSYTGRAVRLDVRAGGVGFDGATPGAMALARLTAEAPFASASAVVVGLAPTPTDDEAGAALARLRVGLLAGPWIRFEVAALHGARATDARLLEDGLLAEPRVFLMSTDGTSGAIEAELPLLRSISLHGRVDADLGDPALLAGAGSIRYAGRCKCFAMELGAGHREGRPGADGFFTVDLAPARAR